MYYMSRVGLVLLLLFPAMLAHANGVIVRAGTSGIGVEYELPVTKRLNARLVASKLNLGGERELSHNSNRYLAKLDTKSAGVLLDFHPVDDGAFHLTFGLLSHRNSVYARNAGSTYRLNRNEYRGTANVLAAWDSGAPYLGFGWSRQIKSGLGIDLQFGAILHGDAVLSVKGSGAPEDGNSCDYQINAHGTFSSDTACAGTLRADALTEYREAQRDLEGFKFWPSISVGIQFSF